MSKILSITIGLCAIVAMLSIVYYYCVFLPQERYAVDLANNQQECLTLQQSILTQYEKDYGQITTQATARNHYNQKLHKCYVEIDEVDEISPTSFTNWYYVYDATEDKPLIDCLFPTEKTDTTLCGDDRGQNHTSESSAFLSPKSLTTDQFNEIESEYMSG